jgi:phosphoglycolate phosphatase
MGMNVAPERPRAILFDWDNTLIDSWPTIHAATNVTLAAMGHPVWTLDETKGRVRKSLRDEFPILYGERWEEARDIYYRAFLDVHLRELTPMKGVAQMLESLSAEGIYLGVVSNKVGNILRAEVAHLGWERYFGALVGAGDAARDKPACDPIELALKSSGHVAGSTIWYVGDTNIDMECACAATCVPVLLRDHDAGEGEFSAHPPVYTFKNPSDFLGFLGLDKVSATPKSL